jgi:hypothetical protein
MKKYALYLIATLLVALGSCDKDDDVDPNEEELITTVKINLLASGSTTPEVFTFKDIDGPGGAAPTIDSIIIDAGKQYTAVLQFLNESVSPPEDITAEIATEADDHQIYFTPAGMNINATNLNTDSNGLPVGITSAWQTGGAGKGTMTITLKHKPGTKAAGDPVSKGETDVEVVFGVRLK